MINHYAIPPSCGGGTRHYSLARRLVERGHAVRIVAGSFGLTDRPERPTAAALEREAIDGVDFVWARTPTFRGNGVGRLRNSLAFARAIGELPRFLKERPDVVFGSTPHLFASDASARLAARLRTPFVLEVRDIWPQSLIDIAGVSPRHPIVSWMRRLERRGYARAAAIVGLMPGLEAHVRGLGFDRVPVTPIPNGIDLDLVPAPRAAPAGPFTVLYAGQMGPPNCLEPLIDAARLLAKCENVRFRLIGAGVSAATLRERATGLANVAFEPAVPKREVYALLQSGSAFYAGARRAALYRHGISFNKLFDYMAIGRPIVFAGDVPDNPVSLSGCGVVVPGEDPEALASAIEHLAAMPAAEREALGELGRWYVTERHGMDALADRLERTLLDVCD
jgi:glycosyltransferase involved in cell wall biosynthesis